MNFRKLNIPKIYSRLLAWNPSFLNTDLFDSPSCCFFPSLIIKYHLPQTIKPALQLPRRHIMCSWVLEKKDIPCSLADILRHSCLYFCLWSFCCWPPGALATPLFLLSSHSSSPAHTPRFPSIASGQTADLFLSPINGTAYWTFEAVCLLGNAGNDECEYSSCCNHVGVVFSGCISFPGLMYFANMWHDR